jgi:OmpA-OmpF porin, OOP family
MIPVTAAKIFLTHQKGYDSPMKKILASVALLLCASSAPAFAEGWYVGLGAGIGNLGKTGQDITGLTNSTIDDSDKTYTIRGGYRFHPNVAVEVGYYDLGKYTFSGRSGSIDVSGSAKAKSFGVSLVGIAPVSQNLELYGRLGIEESEIKANANTANFTASEADKQTGATYGLGARYLFNKNIGVFAEWMKNDKIEVDSYLLGVDFRF